MKKIPVYRYTAPGGDKKHRIKIGEVNSKREVMVFQDGYVKGEFDAKVNMWNKRGK